MMQVDWFRAYSPGTPTELHGRKMFRVSSSSSPSPVTPSCPVSSPLARVPPGSPISRSSGHTAPQFFKSSPTSSLPRGLERGAEAFCEGQEWTLPRSAGDIRLGVLGTAQSGKTKVIQYFLQMDGLFRQDSMKEDGRYKCKVVIEECSRLLLIREGTGIPSPEFCNWLDALILVFSYHDESTVTPMVEIYQAFQEGRGQEVPVLIVGTVVEGQEPVVRDEVLKKITDIVHKAVVVEVALTENSNSEEMFMHACRLVLESQGLLGGVGQGTPLQLQAPPPSSKKPQPVCSPIAARKKRMSRFLSATKGAYTVQSKDKELIGPGRDIPRKEGEVKKNGKKKYLVVGNKFITYYPSHSDYCKNTNEKGVCLDKITVRDPDRKLKLAARSKEQLDGSANVSGTTSPIPDTGHISPSASDVSSMAMSPAQELEVESEGEACLPRSRDSSTLTINLTGISSQKSSTPSEGSVTKANGVLEVPITLQQFHDQRQKSDKTPGSGGRGVLGAASSPQRGSSSSLNVPPAPSIETPAEIPRSSTLSSEVQRKMLAVAVEEMDHHIMPKKGSFRHGRGHKRGRSWGGAKALESELNQPPEGLEFHIINCDGKAWVFEASSVVEKHHWIKIIEEGIRDYFSNSTYRKEENSLCAGDMADIQGRPGNDFCADCNSTKPEWASLNLGCLLCINCSGVHRNLGAHISKVRSLSLDVWRPEFVSVMLACCNHFTRNIYETKPLPRGVRRPIHSASREEREVWIRAKYEKKEYLADLPTGKLTLGERIMEVVDSAEVCYEDLLLLLAHSSPEDINQCHKGGRAPMHVVCARGHVVALQLLLWYFADINIKDEDQRTPLTYARYAGHDDCAEVLLHNSCRDDSFEADMQLSVVLQASVI